MKNIFKWWKNFFVDKKISISIAISLIGIAAVIIFTFWLFTFHFNTFNQILEDHSNNQELHTCFSNFQSAFEQYAWNRNEESQKNYDLASANMDSSIRKLPTTYSQIGRERYLRTMSVIHGYEGYKERCDHLLTLSFDDPVFIDQLYLCYDTGLYIQLYIDRLVDVTLKNNTLIYQSQLKIVHNLSYILLLSVVFLCICLYFYRKSILSLEKQKQKIQQEKKIKENELLQIQMEQTLNEIQIRLLQSQINPHFLFNTLTLISGMAQIENAKNTKEMTQCLSNIFRYNLKSEGSITTLFSEIAIAKDYIYLQQCRFGKRVQLLWDIQSDPSEILLPTFTLQPILENAVIHGISPKEDGGIIRIRIYSKDGYNYLTIIDNGLGIPPEIKSAIISCIKNGGEPISGIGVTNISARFKMLYPDSSFQIHSKYGYGTLVKIRWKNTIRT